MKAYGYTKDFEESEHGYCEVSKVALYASPTQLREVSNFLLAEAKEMEILGADYDHVHLQNKSEQWDESLIDIIVCKNE